MQKDDPFRNLLSHIKYGLVVPVVGQGVLSVLVDGQLISVYKLLAKKLAERLGVLAEGVPVNDEINTVVYRYLEQNDPRTLDAVYTDVTIAMDELMQELDFPIPESLEKLAAIKHFKLFVSTTFDPLLVKALERARGGKPDVVAYSPGADLNLADLRPNADGKTTVFHLFGKASIAGGFAVTQEDTLEFMHTLQSPGRLPERLLDELRDKHLLVMGCRFNGWLARFFLRTIKRERLLEARGTNYVADSLVMEDSNLVLFLKKFSPKTRVYEGTVSEFVDALYTQWYDQYGAEEEYEVASASTGSIPRKTLIDKPRVFISYASEDQDIALKFNEALMEHMDVYFDGAKGGEDWEQTLKESIEECWLFVPLISRNTLTPERRYFRKEWAMAEELSSMASPELAFVVPVVIDDTKINEKGIARYSMFTTRHWIQCRQGGPTEEFVARIKDLYRAHQKARSAL